WSYLYQCDAHYADRTFCGCFFFSSRRRHTISKRDWSSDVCSSDLSATTPSNPSLTGCEKPRAPMRCSPGPRAAAAAPDRFPSWRSEERRVGKEGRYWWRPERLKKEQ